MKTITPLSLNSANVSNDSLAAQHSGDGPSVSAPLELADQVATFSRSVPRANPTKCRRTPKTPVQSAMVGASCLSAPAQQSAASASLHSAQLQLQLEFLPSIRKSPWVGELYQMQLPKLKATDRAFAVTADGSVLVVPRLTNSRFEELQIERINPSGRRKKIGKLTGCPYALKLGETGTIVTNGPKGLVGLHADGTHLSGPRNNSWMIDSMRGGGFSASSLTGRRVLDDRLRLVSEVFSAGAFAPAADGTGWIVERDDGSGNRRTVLKVDQNGNVLERILEGKKGAPSYTAICQLNSDTSVFTTGVKLKIYNTTSKKVVYRGVAGSNVFRTSHGDALFDEGKADEIRVVRADGSVRCRMPAASNAQIIELGSGLYAGYLRSFYGPAKIIVFTEALQVVSSIKVEDSDRELRVVADGRLELVRQNDARDRLSFGVRRDQAATPSDQSTL